MACRLRPVLTEAPSARTRRRALQMMTSAAILISATALDACTDTGSSSGRHRSGQDSIYHSQGGGGHSADHGHAGVSGRGE